MAKLHSFRVKNLDKTTLVSSGEDDQTTLVSSGEDDQTTLVSSGEDQIVFISISTAGQGDIPSNAKDFYADLCAKEPDLKHVYYSVFGCGSPIRL
jgi:sulfite reductase alpha subunit-like flavoprotein